MGGPALQLIGPTLEMTEALAEARAAAAAGGGELSGAAGSTEKKGFGESLAGGDKLDYGKKSIEMAKKLFEQAEKVKAEGNAWKEKDVENRNELQAAAEKPHINGAESYAIAEKRRQELQAERSKSIEDTDGLSDKVKHGLDWVGKPIRQAYGYATDVLTGQDLSKTSGERAEINQTNSTWALQKAYRQATQQAERQFELGTGRLEIEANKARTNGDTGLANAYQDEITGKTAAVDYQLQGASPKAAADGGLQKAIAQSLDRDATANGSRDAAYSAAVQRDQAGGGEAARQSAVDATRTGVPGAPGGGVGAAGFGDGIEKLRGDVNRNHAQLMSAITHKNFSRP